MLRLPISFPRMASVAKRLKIVHVVLCSAIPQWNHVVYIPGPHKQGGGFLFARFAEWCLSQIP